MTIKELIEKLEELRLKYGDDIEVKKLKHLDYLSPIFKDAIVYNQQNKVIEI